MNTHHALISIVLLVSLLTLYYIHNLSVPGLTLYSPSIAYEQQLPSDIITDPTDYDNKNNTTTFINNNHNNNNNNNNIKHPPWLCDCFHYDSPLPLLLRDTPIPHPVPVIDGQDLPLIELNQSIAAPDERIRTIINNNLHYPKTLLFTVANYDVRHYVYNWIKSLERTNEDRFVVVCLDPYLYQHLVKAGYKDHAFIIPKQWKYYAIITNPLKENEEDEEDRLLTFTKTIVVQHILNLDITAFYSNVDVIWNLPRTREYVRTLMDIRGGNTHAVFLQEGFQQQEVSTGFFLMRPTPIMQRFISDAIYIQQQHDDITSSITQQMAFNKALTRLNLETRSSNIVLLEVFHFPHFDAYFNRRLHESLQLVPYIIHANTLIGNEKIEKLKENGLWYVDEHWLSSIDQLISI